MKRPSLYLSAVGAVALAYIVLVVYTTIGGKPVLPVVLNSVVIAAIFAAAIITVQCGIAIETRRYVERRHAQTLEVITGLHQDTRAYYDARLDALALGQVEHGMKLTEITGEIPRVRPIVTACHHHGSAVGLDSNVMELGRRISGQLRAPSMRHDD